MKAREFGSVALKVLGIFWFIKAFLYVIRVSSLPFIMPYTEISNTAGINWTIEIINLIVIASLYATASYFMIFRTQYIMRIIKIDENISEEITSPDRKNNYEGLAFTLIGLYFAVPALSHIVPQLIKLWSLGQPVQTYGMYQESYLEKMWPNLVENIIELVIGVVLILGRNRLAQLWRRLRPLSTVKDEKI